MKFSKLILTGVIATAFTSGAFAQTETVATNEVVVTDTIALATGNEEESTLKEIKISELPQAVQESLASDLYKNWEPQRAWIVQKDGKDVYKIEVKNEEETQNLLFDENGTIID